MYNGQDTPERVHGRTYFLNTAMGELPFNGLCMLNSLFISYATAAYRVIYLEDFFLGEIKVR